MKKIVLLLLICIGVFGAEVHWADSFKGAVAAAKEGSKPILFILSGRHCPYCRLLENTTLQDKKVVKELNAHFISYMTYVEDGKPFPKQLFRPVTPTIWFLYDNGQALAQPIMGAVDAKQFLKILHLVEQGFTKEKRQEEIKYMKSRM
jgi:thioredoxin-related protein